jgi:hypothetical protein
MNNVAPASPRVSGSTVYAGYYDLGIWRSSDAGQSWQMTTTRPLPADGATRAATA